GFLTPVAMLSLAMVDTVTALNPIALVWSIARIPGSYLVAAIAFGLVIGAYMTAEDIIGRLLPVPLLGYVLAGFLNLYFLAVAMRLLWLLYLTHEQKIGV